MNIGWSATRATARLTCVVILLVLFLSPATFSVVAAQPADTKLILVSWDAAADWVMDRLLAEGKMPNVARLCKEGVRAEYVVPCYPSITGPTHATMWTGAPPDIHGITYNNASILPKSKHTVLEKISGFDSSALLAEPIWMTVLKAGKRCVLLSAAQSEPRDVYYRAMKKAGIPRDHLTGITGGFGNTLVGERVYGDIGRRVRVKAADRIPAHSGDVRVFPFAVGDTRFKRFIFDAKSDPAVGYDTALVRRENGVGESWLLKPGWSSPGTTDKFTPEVPVTVKNKRATVRFRLFELAGNGSLLMFYHTSAARFATCDLGDKSSALVESAGEANVPFGLYDRAILGKPVWEGGKGDAERRLVELVRLAIEHRRAETRAAMSLPQWDLLMHYSPFADSFEHIAIGYLDSESKAYNADYAAKLWPYMEELYRIHDDWAGEMLALKPANSVVAIVSDHGQQGYTKMLNTNVILKNAGLLALGRDGEIDLARTRALAPPWYIGDGVVVNDVSWKGGIVSIADREAVLKQAEKALMAVVDPETGAHPVVKTYRSPDQKLSLGGPRTVDMVYDPAPDYATTNGITKEDKEIRVDTGGAHGQFPWRERLRSVFYASGPGLRTDAILPPMDSVSVIPTLCKAIGWPAPKDATGRPVLGAGF